MNDHKITLDGGQIVYTGLEPRVSALGDNPVLSDEWMLSDEECVKAVAEGAGDLSAGVFWPNCMNQNPFGLCWAFASVGAMMTARYLAGHAKEILLPDAGAVVCGTSSGYPIDWALTKWVLPVGIPPASVAPKADPFAYNGRDLTPSDWAADWKAQAAARKGIVCPEAPTNKHVRCAVLRGWPCNAGIFWQDNPRSGHALEIVQVEYAGNQWFWVGPNSWGGLNGWFDHPTRKGWFRIPESKWDVATFSAWAMCAAGWSPQDGVAPKA